MASQSLYRKWRSQTFGELVGQEPVIRTLKNALSSDSLAHAYLFTGPRGTGKTSTARLLAKTINCLQPKQGEPCNACEQCREITAGNSFNVVEIDAASNRGIDSIRELREKVMMPPTTGKYKVYILDEAHMLTVEAFNALLKTLEEPPPHAIFVMATTDVHKMLPTVLSRCQRFDFKRITTRQIVDHLRFVATQETVTLEHGAAELIARAASGGMRDALSLLDQAVAYAGSTVALTQVQAMLGVADPRAIQKFISAVADLDSPAGLHLIHELAEAGADLRQINSQIAEYWRAMMLARAGANIGEILDHTDDEISEIIRMSQLFVLEELTECAKVFAQNELVQRNQGTPQLGLELALLSCLELHRRDRSSQTVASPTHSSGRIPASPSVMPSASKKAYDSQSHPSVPVSPATSASLSAPAKEELAETPIVSAVPAPALASASSSISQSPPDMLNKQQTIKQPGSAQGTTPTETSGVEREASDPPDWDNVPHYDEEDMPDQGPSVPLDAPVRTVASVSQNLFLSQASSEDVHEQNTTMGTEIKEKVIVGSPGLVIQEVKEKWEYVKRRVRSKKDGAKIAALLNGYTVVNVEGHAGVPVVVIAATALFHYTTLQKQAYGDAIEWALKAELGQDCKVRMLPPGQGGLGPGVNVLPPSIPSPAINNAAASRVTSTSETTPLPSSYANQERRGDPLQLPTTLHTKSEPQTRQMVSPSKEEPQTAPDQTRPAASSAAIAYELSSESSSLARTTEVRENTTRVSNGDSRLMVARKNANNDQVVQEVVRLFKAEVKDIQPK